jgi:putative addiction module component (TIGR02574 family)
MATIETPALSGGLTPELLERNLRLSRADRELLVLRLKESLEADDPPEVVDAAWKEDIARRLDEVNHGKVQLVDAFESLDRVMDAVRRRRTS